MTALGFYGIRAVDGASLTSDELLSELAGAEAVCFGEEHANRRHHEAEVAVVTALLERARASGREVGVGLAMLPVNQQRFLNAFAKGKLNLEQFEEASHWSANWPYPFQLYTTLLTVANKEGAVLVALNTRLRRAAPRQTEDRGIAATAAVWLGERRPLRQLVIIAGLKHCRQSAVPEEIVRQLRELKAFSVVAVPTELDETPGAVPGYDYTLVLTPDPALADDPEPY